MKTDDKEYKEHLEEKYLPGRDAYLKWVFFPKILRQFNSGDILDLGFGTGGFLRFLKSRKRSFVGIDSNPYLVRELSGQGFPVRQDDITKLETIDFPVQNALTDNVLEHLEPDQIEAFFSAITSRMAKGGVLTIIVPSEKGFERDPTHRTFVDRALVERMCAKNGLKIERSFFHPINVKDVGKFFYLNMQVFTIRF